MTPAQTSPEQANLLSEPPDFSLVLGGPLFQLFRKAHLLANFASLTGSAGRLSFFHDVEGACAILNSPSDSDCC